MKKLILGLALLLTATAAVWTFAVDGPATVRTTAILSDAKGEPGYFLAALDAPLDPPPPGRAYLCRAETENLRMMFPYFPPPKWEAGREPARPRQCTSVLGRFAAPGLSRLALLDVAADGSGDEKIIGRYEFTIDENSTRATDDLAPKWTSLFLFQSAGSEKRASGFGEYLRSVEGRGRPAFDPRRGQAGNRGGETPDTFSIFSGGAAIHESLQLVGLDSNVPGDGTAEVDLDALRGPQVKSHPFAEMLAGRDPALSGLTKFVPEDQYLVLFRDIDKLNELTDLLRDSGATLLQRFDQGSREYDLSAKARRSLALEEGLLEKLFAKSVVGEVALTGRDPFFREGTELALLFELKKPVAFREHIEKRYAEAAASRGAEVKAVDILGNKVLTASTPDGSVSSCMAVVGSVGIVSTSQDSLSRVIECAGGGLPSLATAPDLKYMRTIFPGGAAEEDIFVYLSDAHIRHLLGPRWKIGESRRVLCAANLEWLGNASLWRRVETGNFPADMAELESLGYMGGRNPRCPDGGMYRVAPGTGAACSVHGKLGNMTPVGEIPLAAVSGAEAEGYRTFVQRYSTFWSRYFDPIGIRIKLDDGIRAETLILPLIENSYYTEILNHFGQTPGVLSEKNVLSRTVASGRFRIPPETKTKLAGEFTRPGSRAADLLAWVGDEFSVNVCDGEPILEAGRRMEGGFTRDPVERLLLEYVVMAASLPSYVTIEVTDPEAAKRALPTLLTDLVGRDPYGGGPSLETYRADDHKGVPIHTALIDVFIVSLRLHTAVIGDQLVVATRRDILTDLIDGKTLDPPEESNTGTAALTVFRKAYRKLAETSAMSHADEIRNACLDNLLLTGILEGYGGMTPEKALETIGAAKGYLPVCPSGGRYLPVEGSPTGACSIHGTLTRPRSPTRFDRNAPVMKLIASMDRADLTLSLTPEGLRSVVRIETD